MSSFAAHASDSSFGLSARGPWFRRRTATLPDALPSAMAGPVEEDDELELAVDSLAYGGNGVARLNGFVVFVRRGLPGDRCGRG